MKVYLFRAAFLCEDCGQAACRTFGKPAGYDAGNESTWDSDDYPKGPYCDGGGEADCPQNCDNCYRFLENPLTRDGENYVREQAAENPGSSVVAEWLAFYDYINLDQAS